VSKAGCLGSSGAAGGSGLRLCQPSHVEATCGDPLNNGSMNSWLSPYVAGLDGCRIHPPRPRHQLGQSRLLALILASVVEASASSRMAVLATSLQRAGGVIVGASGQRIMITLGLSAGWIRAISIVSPDWLMVLRNSLSVLRNSLSV
jgi:hypothetical protein